MGMRKLLIAAIMSGLFFVTSTSFADAQVTLEWDANTESDLAGYKLYEQMPVGVPELVEDVGNVLTHTFTATGDVDSKSWVLTAYDEAGNESGYSDPAGVPPTKPSLRITIIVEIP